MYSGRQGLAGALPGSPGCMSFEVLCGDSGKLVFVGTSDSEPRGLKV